MRDVAVAVGLTPAALYYHFSDKEQLYVDAVGYAFREVTGVLKSAIEAAATPLAQLESIVGVATKMLAKDKSLSPPDAVGEAGQRQAAPAKTRNHRV